MWSIWINTDRSYCHSETQLYLMKRADASRGRQVRLRQYLVKCICRVTTFVCIVCHQWPDMSTEIQSSYMDNLLLIQEEEVIYRRAHSWEPQNRVRKMSSKVFALSKMIVSRGKRSRNNLRDVQSDKKRYIERAWGGREEERERPVVRGKWHI